jgi:hypothetical protein
MRIVKGTYASNSGVTLGVLDLRGFLATVIPARSANSLPRAFRREKTLLVELSVASANLALAIWNDPAFVGLAMVALVFFAAGLIDAVRGWTRTGKGEDRLGQGLQGWNVKTGTRPALEAIRADIGR